MGIKQALKEARGNRSLRSFAREIGISHTRLDSLERGYDPRTGKSVNITIATLQKISNATGVDISTLVSEVEKQ
jgi:transcriptional regulator with XRE-family HTH domain